MIELRLSVRDAIAIRRHLEAMLRDIENDATEAQRFAALDWPASHGTELSRLDYSEARRLAEHYMEHHRLTMRFVDAAKEAKP